MMKMISTYSIKLNIFHIRIKKNSAYCIWTIFGVNKLVEMNFTRKIVENISLYKNK